MIRFVDIRGQGTGNRFAFWCTVMDKFIEIDGEHAWNNWNDFMEVAEGDLRVESFKGLAKEWVFDNGEDDVEAWYAT